MICCNMFPYKHRANSSCGCYILSTRNMPKIELAILSSQQIHEVKVGTPIIPVHGLEELETWSG